MPEKPYRLQNSSPLLRWPGTDSNACTAASAGAKPLSGSFRSTRYVPCACSPVWSHRRRNAITKSGIWASRRHSGAVRKASNRFAELATRSNRQARKVVCGGDSRSMWGTMGGHWIQTIPPTAKALREPNENGRQGGIVFLGPCPTGSAGCGRTETRAAPVLKPDFWA
jgi:hypothetical protein